MVDQATCVFSIRYESQFTVLDYVNSLFQIAMVEGTNAIAIVIDQERSSFSRCKRLRCLCDPVRDMYTSCFIFLFKKLLASL